jgi:hypothetical protein
VQLQPNRIGGEAMTGQPHPGHGVLALFDRLLRRAAVIVECHHTAGAAPRPGLVAEAGVVAAHPVRWATLGRLTSHETLSCRTQLAGNRIVYF